MVWGAKPSGSTSSARKEWAGALDLFFSFLHFFSYTRLLKLFASSEAPLTGGGGEGCGVGGGVDGKQRRVSNKDSDLAGVKR